MDHGRPHEIDGSELILNSDGSIYHLGLHPEDEGPHRVVGRRMAQAPPAPPTEERLDV